MDRGPYKYDEIINLFVKQMQLWLTNRPFEGMSVRSKVETKHLLLASILTSSVYF